MDLIARRLVALQHSAGGWSYTEDVQLPDVDCTSVAVEVLHLAGPGAYRVPLRRALGALHALRGEDGGFPTYLTGAPSEACMTAAAANALSTQGPAYRHEFETALAYLASHQRPDGSYPPDWSSSRLHTVFRAVLAASRHPRITSCSPARRIIDKAVNLMADSQNADGGWGQQDGDASDALSTAYALTALSTQNTPGHAARGAAYLLTQQRPDGSIASIPDSIGPRPFGFTVPALADVFALLALGHLTRRIAPAPRRIPSVTSGDRGERGIRESPARHRAPRSREWTALPLQAVLTGDVTRHSRRHRGRPPSSKAGTSSRLQPLARSSTRARGKKWTAKPPCSQMPSSRMSGPAW